MNVDRRTLLAQYLQQVEVLYIIHKASGIKKEKNQNPDIVYPYTYRDGLEMSTSDIVRVTYMQLRDLEEPLKRWRANKILSNLLKLGYIEEDSAYIAYSSTTDKRSKKKRLIYKNTEAGLEYLDENIDNFVEAWGDNLNKIGHFDLELKKKLMPNLTHLIDSDPWKSAEFKKWRNEKYRKKKEAEQNTKVVN